MKPKLTILINPIDFKDIEKYDYELSQQSLRTMKTLYKYNAVRNNTGINPNIAYNKKPNFEILLKCLAYVIVDLYNLTYEEQMFLVLKYRGMENI